MFEGLQKTIMRLTERFDIALAVLLVSIIFMMILPLPTWLVDVLIALNMATAIILLMVSVYIKTPVAFAAFPSVLLLTTLFRLALSITTTRLILLQADAGEIIYTFGDFVVAGSLIVGIVIFLIITLVQFIVVTKGSERVAEVTARFSLDGMPGKQISIDSDLRAGLITMDQARQRRSDLEKESQLYGSMDGAMKFVKGDAIAGILIILVNIIGGISIGVLQNGMSTAQALELYTILTIGDGLVSQIPALFIAITSGIIVTRVTSDHGSNLGADIGNQILAQPNALLIGAVILFGFALIPGFPAAIFLVLSMVTGLLGFTLLRMQAKASDPLLEDIPNLAAADAASGDSAETKSSALQPNAPILIEISSSARDSVTPQLLNAELGKVRASLYEHLGVPFPKVHLRYTETLEPDSYQIYLNDVPAARGTLGAERLLTHNIEELQALEIPFEPVGSPLAQTRAAWVSSEYAQKLQAHNLSTRSSPQIIAEHLGFVLNRHADEFVGTQETHQLLTLMENQYGELVKEALRTIPVHKIADVLRRLVAEGISIRNLRAILEGIVEWAPQEQKPEQLVEFIRMNLKRQISYRFSAGQNVLPVLLVDPAIEGTLRDSIRQTPSGSYLALEPEDSRHLLNSIKEHLGDATSGSIKPALLTTLDLRRHIRKLIAMDFHDLPVLSYQELAPEITVQPMGKVGLAGGAAAV